MPPDDFVRLLIHLTAGELKAAADRVPTRRGRRAARARCIGKGFFGELVSAPSEE